MASALNNTVKFMAKMNNIVTESMDLNLSANSVLDEYAQLPTISNKLTYPVSYVPVAAFKEHHDAPRPYGVSINALSLFMEMNNLRDVVGAVRLIAEANDISDKDICLVMPGDDLIRKEISEAKQDTEPASAKLKVKHLQNTGAMVKDLRNYGLCVCKEPGVMDIKWDAKTNIVNIDRTSSFGDGVDWDSLKNY